MHTRWKQPSTWAGMGTIAGLAWAAIPVEMPFYRGATWACAIVFASLAILLNEHSILK